MNFINKLSGFVVYYLSYPITRLLLKNSRRSYLAVIYDNQLLVTKNWLGDQRTWRLVGGGVHKKENYLDAVIREAREEVNLAFDQASLKQIVGISRHPKGYYYAIFLIKFSVEPKIIRSKEIIEAQFISIDQLIKGKIPISLEVATLLSKLER